jgi:phosphatidylinositol alpha-1,6-mannosyltransferase
VSVNVAWSSLSPRLLDPEIILVSELFPPAIGGSATLFHDVYSRVGAPVTVLTDALAGSVEQRSSALRIVRMPMGAPSWGLLHVKSVSRYSRLALRLAREARRTNAIVHCGRALPEGLGAALAQRMCGGSRFLCWAHGEELDYAGSSRELTLLQAQVHGLASRVIANSRNTARKLQAAGVPQSKISVVHPGVDASRFGDHPDARALRRRLAPNGELLLLTVGRLQRRKGHDLVIRALGEMNNGLSNMRYVIVGEGDEHHRLRQIAVDAGVRDRVEFVGGVSPELLPAYYAASDIFVHPNRDEQGDAEGFGIVFLEAAAAALPSIGGNNGGVPESVQSGVTGVLVGGNDVAELAGQIRLLATSDVLRRQMGEAGRARARDQFSWERAAAEVMAVHRDMERAQCCA